MPNHSRRSLILALFFILLLTSQACVLGSQLPASDSAATESPHAVAATSTPGPLPSATADVASRCPTPSGTNSLFLSRENGFCFLYPSEYPIQPDGLRPEEAFSILGPHEPGDFMEPVTLVLGISYNGSAEGLTSAAYAERWFQLYTAGSNVPYEPSLTRMDGQEAVILSNLPGFPAKKAAFVVANGIKYQISLSPQPESSAILAEDAAHLWDTVIDSLVFFPPENDRVAVRADEVCPSSTADTALYRNDLEGYCFLYPASFKPDAALPGRVEGGPVVFTHPDFGEVRISLTLGTLGAFPGKTPSQVIEMRDGGVESLSEITIGGYPAVMFRNTEGPWASRQALILVHDAAYTIVAQPDEPAAYATEFPYFNQLWDTVVGSLAFFTPWR